MHHLAKSPKRSTVIKAKVDEAIREIVGGRQSTSRPWERAVEARREQVRETYFKVGQDLRAAKDDVSRKAADQLAGFLKAFPPLETKRARTKRQLAAVLENGYGPKSDRPQGRAKSVADAPIEAGGKGKEGREI